MRRDNSLLVVLLARKMLLEVSGSVPLACFVIMPRGMTPLKHPPCQTRNSPLFNEIIITTLRRATAGEQRLRSLRTKGARKCRVRNIFRPLLALKEHAKREAVRPANARPNHCRHECGQGCPPQWLGRAIQAYRPIWLAVADKNIWALPGAETTGCQAHWHKIQAQADQNAL